MPLTHRLATMADVPSLSVVMDAAIAQLQRDVLSPEQIRSSRAIMGLDTQLVQDGTYFVVESDGEVAGCGGWSRRATMYGSDRTPGRDPELLDPKVDAARVRAMYTNPAFARRGVGRLILTLCERAAAEEGFRRLQLVSTLAGEPLYTAFGFEPVERIVDSTGAPRCPWCGWSRTSPEAVTGTASAAVRQSTTVRNVLCRSGR